MLPLTLFGPIIGVLADQVSREAAACTFFRRYNPNSNFYGHSRIPRRFVLFLIAIVSFLSGIFWATDMPIRRRLLGDLAGDKVSAAMGLDLATEMQQG